MPDRIPERVTVSKATRLNGELTAPPSKAYSHRALMVASLCEQPVVVENPLLSQDILATADAWSALGASITYDKSANRFHVRGTRAPLAASAASTINVRESGTTLRLLLPGLALASAAITVEGNGSLRSRPNRMVIEPLRGLGVRIEGTGADHTVPITVRGQGYLPAGEVAISGAESSQVVSAFLLWLPLATSRAHAAPVTSVVKVVGNMVSKPYVDITIDVLKWAGIRIEPGESNSYSVPGEQRFVPGASVFTVNGDYSSAAFALVAACLCDGQVLVKGLRNDQQGDRQIVPVLRQMGANLEELPEGILVKGASRLRGLELDCSWIPDLVPILCVAGIFAEGRTVLKNIAHLRFKESDRLQAPAQELGKLGARISCTGDSITIEKSALVCATVSARGDHRLAMSLMVAGLAGNGAIVDGAHSIDKSYPTFIDDMRSLGGRIVAS